MALWVVPMIFVGAGLVAVAARELRAMRRAVERDEKRRTREYEAARKARLRAVERHEALRRELAKERDARRRTAARRRYEYDARAVLSDELSAIQKRAWARIKNIDQLLKSGMAVRGERARGWIDARKARSLPREDLRRLYEGFRELEVQLSRREYEKDRLHELIQRCGALKGNLTARSVHFKDADRFRELLPDESSYRDVPEDLPAMYAFVQGEWRNNCRGKYFLLPHGITGHLAEGEPSLRGIRPGSVREVFVHRIDYRNREAVVSPGAASLLRAAVKEPGAHFMGEIEALEKAGARVRVHGVRCFLPKRFVNAGLAVGGEVEVRFEEIDHFLRSPVVVPTA